MIYRFKAKVWIYDFEGASSWYFLTLPSAYSEELKSLREPFRAGFGSIKVLATIGASTWTTSIFPDTKSGCYMLPLKKAIRQAEALEHDTQVDCRIEVVAI